MKQLLLLLIFSVSVLAQSTLLNPSNSYPATCTPGQVRSRFTGGVVTTKYCNAAGTGWTDISGSGGGAGDLLAANNLSDVASTSTARSNLGLAIGTNVQAYDADLTTYAGITPSANVQTLLGSADYAAMRTSLGLVIGTNVQAYDAQLADLAGLSYAGNSLKVVRVNAGETAFEVATLAGGGDALVANPLSQFASTTSAQLAGVLSNETGSGLAVFATSPVLTTPDLGTPSAATLTNATGLPIATGVSGLGSGVATFLATPSSANLASALTNETGSGVAVFGTSPELTTSLTTGSTTFALLNTTATTVNAFGAATTLNIGASATTILNFGGSTTAAEFRYLEPSGSGTNYSAFKAVAQSANITYSLPATVGAAGTVLTDAAGDGVLSWAAGGGGSPGGSTKQLQFNNAGAFGGAAGFEYQSGASPNVLITAQAASYVPLVIRAAASQSGLLTDWQNSSSSSRLYVSSAAVLGANTTDGARDFINMQTDSLSVFKFSNTGSYTGVLHLGYNAATISNTNGNANITFSASGASDSGSGVKIDAALLIKNIATTLGYGSATDYIFDSNRGSHRITGGTATAATWYANRFGQVTLSGHSATQTVTDSATVRIDGPVIAGSSSAVTLTRNHSLWVAAGVARFDGDVQLGADGPRWIAGSGSPESAVTAPVGSIYSRTDGGASTSFYVKESGSGNTGWIAK